MRLSATLLDSIKPFLPHVESEHLLRLALFSNLLQLQDSDDARDSIVTRRTELARNLREGRKKGVIPIFISFLWFVFALALTIELAFDDIGGNETAHNLALGLMVCWLPVLIVATAVDRNSVSADSIQQRLNELLEDVRHALIDPTTLLKYKQMSNTRDDAFEWTAALHDNTTYDGEFFVSFGGQGREHFHYGVAHPILSAIETTFMAEYGRDWLRHGFATRVAMVGGSTNISGLKSFDPRMIWQVVSSLTIVSGSVFGAFILSCTFVKQSPTSAMAYFYDDRVHAHGWAGVPYGRLSCLPRSSSWSLGDRNGDLANNTSTHAYIPRHHPSCGLPAREGIHRRERHSPKQLQA